MRDLSSVQQMLLRLVKLTRLGAQQKTSLAVVSITYIFASHTFLTLVGVETPKFHLLPMLTKYVEIAQT